MMFTTKTSLNYTLRCATVRIPDVKVWAFVGTSSISFISRYQSKHTYVLDSENIAGCRQEVKQTFTRMPQRFIATHGLSPGFAHPQSTTFLLYLPSFYFSSCMLTINDTVVIYLIRVAHISLTLTSFSLGTAFANLVLILFSRTLHSWA